MGQYAAVLDCFTLNAKGFHRDTPSGSGGLLLALGIRTVERLMNLPGLSQPGCFLFRTDTFRHDSRLENLPAHHLDSYRVWHNRKSGGPGMPNLFGFNCFEEKGGSALHPCRASSNRG
jgi:hypothetical protein